MGIEEQVVDTSLPKSAVDKGGKAPQVSIGMPVYNGERFIREALDSLLAQIFTDFELIISDNASTDGTEAICRDYVAKDARIRYVRQTENRGAAANFQFVLDEAVGEYFMWASADDIWSRGWCKVLVSKLERGADICFGESLMIHEDARVIEHLANRRKPWYMALNSTLRQIMFYLYPGGLGKAMPMYSIFKRDILTKEFYKTRFDTSYGPDTIFLFSLIKKNSIKFQEGEILYKRIICSSEGAKEHKNINSSQSKVYKLFLRTWNSVQFLDHYKYSNYSSRLILVIFFPIAYLVHFHYFLFVYFRNSLNRL